MLASEVTGAASTAATTTAPSAADLGREDFLRMLIAQLENQDPLEPQDATAFTAQLAQFSSLEQLIAIRQATEGGTDTVPGTSIVEAAALLGREVLAESDHIAVDSSAPRPLEFHLATPANNVRLELLDSAGGTARTLELGSRGTGFHAIQWDGLDDGGTPLAPGTYTLRDSAGVISPLTRGLVSSATPAHGGLESTLTVDGVSIPLSAVVEISVAEVRP